MGPLAHTYILTSTVLVGAGLAIVYHAVQAYRTTERRSMLHLSIGFTFVVAAGLLTAVNVLTNGFALARPMLLAQSGITSTGYLFVLYSLISYNAA
jgi:uncharacterized membrane protein